MNRIATLRSLLVLISLFTLAQGSFAAAPRKAAKGKPVRTERRMVAPFVDPTMDLAAWTEQQRAAQTTTVRVAR